MFITKRPTVEAMEHRLGEVVPLLDHGYIKLWDYLGDDSSIAQAARVSYQKGTKTLKDDETLIRYLIEHKHTSPLEMCEIKIEMKLPIFVARQLIRHRTASVNEVSARYSILEREFYVPEAEHCAPQSQTNKQGRGGELTPTKRKLAQQRIHTHSEQSYQEYEYLLGEDSEGNEVEGVGLTRELARAVLPVNFYTKWIWKIDLHNLLHFLRLRMDSHAQYEIRVYANAICDIVKDWVPIAYTAFENATLKSKTFTGEEMELIRGRIGLDDIGTALFNNWSERRKSEFLAKLKG